MVANKGKKISMFEITGLFTSALQLIMPLVVFAHMDLIRSMTQSSEMKILQQQTSLKKPVDAIAQPAGLALPLSVQRHPPPLDSLLPCRCPYRDARRPESHSCPAAVPTETPAALRATLALPMSVMKHYFMFIYMLYSLKMVRTKDHRGLWLGDWYAYLR